MVVFMSKFQRFLILCAFFLSGLGVSSCQYDVNHIYWDEEIVDFHKYYDFNSYPYVYNEIAFTMSVSRKTSYADDPRFQEILIGMFSKVNGRSVYISDAVIGEANNNMVLDVQRPVELDVVFPRQKLYGQHVLLGEVESGVLESFADDGKLRISVSYTVDGTASSMTFVQNHSIWRSRRDPT